MTKTNQAGNVKRRSKRKKIIKRLSRLPAASLNYHLGNYEEPVWLVGDGRSGTTWLGSLVNWDKKYRELYEPVHPGHVRRARPFGFHPYLRPDDQTSAAGDFLHSVFSGSFKHFRADVSKPRLIYDGLLIKDIFANLLVGWVHQNVPTAKKIMIVRNPFSAALSKQRYRDWIWMTDPKGFLSQSTLMEDYLTPFESLIQRSTDDFVENQILIWAIIHYVPFQQLSCRNIYVLFYEDLFCQPEAELLKLFNYLYDDAPTTLSAKLISKIHKPSRSQGDGFSTLSAKKPLDVWKDQLRPEQIENGLKILAAFGLDQLYGDDSLPRKKAVETLFRVS